MYSFTCFQVYKMTCLHINGTINVLFSAIYPLSINLMSIVVIRTFGN